MLTAASPCALAYGGSCSARSAILYQPDTGAVLYERQADSRSLIASTTKILTALVVLETCSPDDIVEILPEYTGVEGSSMYLKAGERFTVRELLYGLLLVSGNDAAHALACHTAGSDGEFAVLMNKKAAELGCKNSNFANPHGLDDEMNYSTARDLALIMTAAMKNPDFAGITGTKSVYIAGRTLTNHNKLLWNCEGVIGGKTGYTDSAGRTLVSCCERDGMRLICVTISDRDDWADHSALYDWAFGEYAVLNTGGEYTVPVISGESGAVHVRGGIAPRLVKKSDGYTFDTLLPRFVYAPVYKGEPAGSILLRAADGSTESVGLYFDEDVLVDESVPLSLWEQVKWSWYYYNRHSGYVPTLPYA